MVWSSCCVVFMWCGLHVVWSSCGVVFMCCGLHVVWSSCGAVFMWCGLHVVWSSCGVVFMWCGLHVVWSSCGAVFMWCGLHMVWSSCGVVFMWRSLHVVWSSCGVVFMCCGLTISNYCTCSYYLLLSQTSRLFGFVHDVLHCRSTNLSLRPVMYCSNLQVMHATLSLVFCFFIIYVTVFLVFWFYYTPRGSSLRFTLSSQLFLSVSRHSRKKKYSLLLVSSRLVCRYISCKRPRETIPVIVFRQAMQ